MIELFPRPKNPPTIFGGLVLIGAVIVVSAVSIYVFGSHAESTLPIILVAIGLILIVLAIPVYNWEARAPHHNQSYGKASLNNSVKEREKRAKPDT